MWHELWFLIVKKDILQENTGSLVNGPSVVTSDKCVSWADVVKRKEVNRMQIN